MKMSNENALLRERKRPHSTPLKLITVAVIETFAICACLASELKWNSQRINIRYPSWNRKMN